MADCVSNRRAEPRQDGTRSGRLASTRRDRSLIFRRKVLALSKSWWRHPKEEDNIWCCLHQQPTLPQAPVRATTPIREEWRKLVFNYSCTHPSSLLFPSLVLSYTAYRALPPSGSSARPLSEYPQNPTSFFAHSICHAVVTNNEFMELRETKRNSFASMKNVYIYIVCASWDARSRNRFFRHLWLGRYLFLAEINVVPNVLYFLGTFKSNPFMKIEEALILSIKIY